MSNNNCKLINNKYFFGITLILILILFSECNTKYVNREEDIKEAEQVVREFYGLIKEHQYKETFKFFSNEFWIETDSSQLMNSYQQINNNLGNFLKANIIFYKTRVIEGSNPESKYFFKLKITYDKHESEESIELAKEDGKIKIITYNISAKLGGNK
jgi:hypothetical protein